MYLIIGSKYEETKAMLTEKIRKGDISVLEAEATNHACYFCRKSIDRIMAVLTDTKIEDGKEVTDKYFIDPVCHRKTQHYDEYRGIPNSLS